MIFSRYIKYVFVISFLFLLISCTNTPNRKEGINDVGYFIDNPVIPAEYSFKQDHDFGMSSHGDSEYFEGNIQHENVTAVNGLISEWAIGPYNKEYNCTGNDCSNITKLLTISQILNFLRTNNMNVSSLLFFNISDLNCVALNYDNYCFNRSRTLNYYKSRTTYGGDVTNWYADSLEINQTQLKNSLDMLYWKRSLQALIGNCSGECRDSTYNQMLEKIHLYDDECYNYSMAQTGWRQRQENETYDEYYDQLNKHNLTIATTVYNGTYCNGTVIGMPYAETDPAYTEISWLVHPDDFSYENCHGMISVINMSKARTCYEIKNGPGWTGNQYCLGFNEVFECYSNNHLTNSFLISIDQQNYWARYWEKEGYPLEGELKDIRDSYKK